MVYRCVSLQLISDYLHSFFLPSFLASLVLSTFFFIIIQFSLISHSALEMYFNLRKMKAGVGWEGV